jgi:hypothetical protein
MTCSGLPLNSIAINVTSGKLRMNDNLIEFRDQNHIIGGISELVDGPMFYGFKGVDIGFSNPRTSKLLISAAGLKMGGFTLTDQIWGFLSTITANVEDRLTGSGATLQTRTSNNMFTSLSRYNFGREDGGVIILSVSFQPKSINSMLNFHFDCSWRINGGTGSDFFRSIVLCEERIIGQKIFKLNGNNADAVNRNSSTMLFPISGGFYNQNLNSKQFLIRVFLDAADDNVIIDNIFSYTITEIRI